MRHYKVSDRCENSNFWATKRCVSKELLITMFLIALLSLFLVLHSVRSFTPENSLQRRSVLIRKEFGYFEKSLIKKSVFELYEKENKRITRSNEAKDYFESDVSTYVLFTIHFSSV